MLQSALYIKLAAMAAALGLDTAEWKNPSKEMVDVVTGLEKATQAAIKDNKADQLQGEISEAVKKISELAKSGDKDALFAMGLILQNQQQQGAMEQAVSFYKQAADKGQVQAENNYGFILVASAQRDEKKLAEGVSFIKKAAEAGNTPAMRNMAQFYLNGLAGLKKDAEQARALLEKAAAAKDYQAAYELSQFYAGAGATDDEKALEWLNTAAKGGNPSALDTLGSLYFNGGSVGKKVIKSDPDAAIAQFEELAKQGNAVGLRKMAGVYEAGNVGKVAKDFKKALEYYSKAAQGNDAIAQFRLASMYDTGVDLDPNDKTVDVPRNDAAALNLYRLAAQNKLPIASYNVGVFYEQGRTVDRDLQKAFAAYMVAAQSGVVLAMQKVGTYYVNGAGTIKDPVAAAGWFARTAAAGMAEGHLNYGVLTESIGTTDKGNPFLAAANSYRQAFEGASAAIYQATKNGVDHSAADAIAIEAYVRLGGLYARGVVEPKDNVAQPDLAKAYVYFKQALDVNPKNENLAKAVDEISGKLDKAQQAKAEGDIKAMKAALEKKIQDALDKAKAAPAAADPAAAPAAEVPAAPPAAARPGKKK